MRSRSARTRGCRCRCAGALPALTARFAGLVAVRSEHRGADGSTRFLLALDDGRTIESVLLPGDGVCVSTQVGCAVGCVFCMTGRDGLARHLTSGEIVAQVALARTRQRVRRVVFMGMGEPAHNLDNVLDAITLLGDRRRSRDEEPRVLDGRRPARVRAAAARDRSSRRSRCRCTRRSPSCARSCCRARRASSPPSSSRWPTSTRAPRSTRRSISGRCSKASTTATTSSKRWRRCSQGHYAVVNFIPYNTVDGADFRRPSWQRAAEMTRYLHRRGVLAKLRRSAGQDVEAGCGQLRARAGRLKSRRRARPSALRRV